MQDFITNIKIKILNCLPDKVYLKYKYWRLFKIKLNFKKPQTFNEKLQWLKLYDRNPKYIEMVDKFDAKKYVASILGNDVIIPTLGIYEKFEDIDFDKLPNQFVMKCTHDSGGVIICKNKNNLDIKEVKIKINKCLSKNFYYGGREWPYKKIRPRIIIEKYMQDKQGNEIKDYKFMCFNGKVKCSFICTDRHTKEGLKVTFFDLNWNKMPFERHYPSENKSIKRPFNYELMIEFAEKLSKDIPFVRVDFYEIDRKVYFGELTFYPGSGFEEFTPNEYDKILGDMLMLPKDIKKI